jgi:4-hydroxybutyryl-CoA dehydratase/vinylacetyl-CoA-Delta-isomerase
MIKTADQYVESLRDGRVVYQNGQKIDDLPTFAPFKTGIERAASEYYLATLPEWRELFNVQEKNGEEYSFAYNVPKTADDLQRRRVITQTLTRLGAGGSKLTGVDGLNGVAYAAATMDKAIGTDYGKRVEAFREFCKQTDPGICAAVSDPKGDRRLHAADPNQTHPDFYVRIVDRQKDGIVIRGAKVHISTSHISNELVVLPSRNHPEAGKDYALSCAVSCNMPGVKFLTTDPLITGGGGGHPLIVFDDVFVPKERVFLEGQWQFSRLYATAFARYHRLTAATYKHVSLQVLAGQARLIAEHNGLTHATRIQDMLGWLAMYAEVTEALGKAAALDAKIDPDTGFAQPNHLYTNCAKLWFADNYHQAIKYLQDITGGIAGTMPSQEDWDNEETRPYIEKYLGGTKGYPTEERFKLLQAINRHCSAFGGILTIHAEGSLAAQKMTLFQQADWELFKAAARHSMKMPTDHPAFKDIAQDTPYKLPE